MSGGLINCPIVMRGPANGGTNVGATHSHIPEGLFAAFPGLKVCAPATPADAKGLIKAAIRDNDPVYFMENTRLYGMTGEVPDPADGDFVIPLGVAELKREGKDVYHWSRPLDHPRARSRGDIEGKNTALMPTCLTSARSARSTWRRSSNR
jgi:pyruvate/2-oxoglutarate/acetoin dehydrogenase E1 component